MSNEFLVGAGAGVVGLLVGLAFGGPDETRIAGAVSEKIGSAIESAPDNSEQIGALGAEIAELKAALASVTEAQAGSEAAVSGKLDEAVAALTARMDAVTSDVGAAVTEAGGAQAADIAALIGETSAAQTSQIEATIAAGMQGLESSVSRIAAGAATAPAPTAPDDAEVAAPATQGAPEIEGTRVGETEALLDGKVRVFVSGVDAAAQTVRVAINGLGMQTLGQYRGVSFDADGTSCELTLDGIVEGHVQMTASCAE